MQLIIKVIHFFNSNMELQNIDLFLLKRLNLKILLCIQNIVIIKNSSYVFLNYLFKYLCETF